MKQKIDRKKLKPLINELSKFNYVYVDRNLENGTSSFIKFYIIDINEKEHYYLGISEFGDYWAPFTKLTSLFQREIKTEVKKKKYFGLKSYIDIEISYEDIYTKDELIYVYNYFLKKMHGTREPIVVRVRGTEYVLETKKKN